MNTVETIAALRQALRGWRAEGLSVALVATMGNLHAGHIRLVEEARKQANRVVVSIFVNPTQFGPAEDFAAYPRTPDADAEKLRAAQADLLFMPKVSEIFPRDGDSMAFVELPGLSDILCGKFRPGHFRGVATVVAKLFNLVQPDVALFGEKDYQQLTIIRQMVADLDIPVRIQAVPTVREENGLAMSSRNTHLSDDEKVHAGLLFASLSVVAEALHQGRRDFARMEHDRTVSLASFGFKVDYFAIRRQGDLAMPKPLDRRFVILVAARLGKARLIDCLAVVV